jgi:large subunit ribosomal protein L23
MLPEQVIKRPLVLTEKGNNLRETENQYLFEVDLKANKVQIRRAVQTLFNVKVEKVHTLIMPGKLRRMGRGYAKTQVWKKAIVSLKEGESIDLFEGAS